MKLRILLSIFFLIATTLSAIHEIEHITHEHDSSCHIYHINDNLTSIDIIDESKDIEIFHFENIVQNTKTLNLYLKNKSNQNRAPPKLS